MNKWINQDRFRKILLKPWYKHTKIKMIKIGYIQEIRLMRLHLGFSGVGTFHRGGFGNIGFVFNIYILL